MLDNNEPGAHRTPLQDAGNLAPPPAGGGGREDTVIAAFTSIANSLVEGYDLVDLYSNLTADCARILDIASAGLLLADTQGVLHVVAASSEATRVLELFVLQRQEGPCLDCYRDGTAINVPDLSLATARWPAFVTAARATAGIVSVHAVPLRLHDTTLGVLGLFGTGVGALNPEDLALAQALAHVASVALVAGKATADKTIVNTQLQAALDSRVLIEQAKGLLAQCGDLDMEQAFAVLRRYSRDHNLKLSEIARAVASRALPAAVLLEHPRAKNPPRGTAITQPLTRQRPQPGPARRT